MSPRYTIDPINGIVRIDYEGTAGFADWRGTFEQILSDEDYRPGLHFMGDRRGCTPPSTDSIHLMIGFLKRNAGSFAGTRWAVVGDQIAELGMTRMAQALTHDSPVEVEYFWSPDEAMAWLLDGGGMSSDDLEE